MDAEDTIHPLVAYGRARGNESLNVRDAAHEAFHALFVGTKDWDREKIHRRLVRKLKLPAALWIHEMQARAVEQIVLERLGYDCGSLDRWVSTSVMEAIKFRLPYADYERSLEMARRFMKDPEMCQWADRICALVSSAEAMVDQ